MYGMGFDHSFGLWFMARWLKPDLMIESGAFKGHSTWVLRVDWGSVLMKRGISDLSQVLVFFDDHQNELKRDELCGNGEEWWGAQGYMRDAFNHSNKAISYEEHFQNSRFVDSVLDVYWELPPVAGPSLTHQTRCGPARASDPIIEDGRFGLFQRLGLAKLETSVFNGYTQMVYVKVSASAS
ncbi:hypothetical protein ZIOFF_024412 [Zingiber officinale]|uniref:Uncharacterized protein n=1 Tax=Zingiber officinale TaxID=94328 RepID=A0A8J5GTJ2_ZINOF|nr:hypothetical protein ZIOFF_024412 [Zingiber officinale]